MDGKNPSNLASYVLPEPVQDGLQFSDMSTNNLRPFIGKLINVTCKRKVPMYGQENKKPQWWPTNVPWTTVKSDYRSSPEKKTYL